MTKTNTPTIPAIKVTTGTMAGDVFYGSFDTTVKNKRISVMVSNHIKDVEKQYEFRVAAKCQAGFINISDWTTFPYEVVSSWSKNSLVNVQMKGESGHWFNVLTEGQTEITMSEYDFDRLRDDFIKLKIDEKWDELSEWVKSNEIYCTYYNDNPKMYLTTGMYLDTSEDNIDAYT